MKLIQKFVLSLRNKLKIKGQHNIQIADSAKLRNCNIHVAGKNNTLKIGSNVKLRNMMIEITGDDCEVVIGDDCVIGKLCYLSAKEKATHISLGNGCMLSRNVFIMTSDGHNILKQGKRVNPAKSIEIGDRVWLADNVVVLKGVTIGSDCVVGINSTVTRDITSNQIAVGNPAKVVADGINWQNDLTY